MKLLIKTYTTLTALFLSASALANQAGLYIDHSQLQVPNINAGFELQTQRPSGPIVTWVNPMLPGTPRLDNNTPILKFEIGYIDAKNNFTPFANCTNLQEQGIDIANGTVFEVSGTSVENVVCKKLLK